jgi:short-subunit dehydrogenase
VEAGLFGVHPALLDAVLHALGPAGLAGASGMGGPLLPFSWSGVTLHASGAGVLRARLTRAGDDGITLQAADTAGAPVITARRLVLRPAPSASLPAGPGAGLFTEQWVPVAAGPGPEAGPEGWAVIGEDGGLAGVLGATQYPSLAELAAAAETGAAVPAAVAVLAVGDRDGASNGDAAVAMTARVLEQIQQWLACDRLAGAHLVVVTHAAVAAVDGDRVTDLAAAAGRGLARSAQSENPGQLVLADVDQLDGAGLPGALGAALASGEPEVAVRAGQVLARRLVPLPPADTGSQPGRGSAGGEGTVLVTGGTGVLGGLVARHLAARGRAERLVLASRSGPASPGAARLAARLAARGAATVIAACDAADRDALAGLLGWLEAGPRLSGVVHAAGVLDDGVTGSLTPERIQTVMRPKAAGAWYLHELTAGRDLEMFVLFSSAAGVLGAPGQGNYAAGNAFLDALARHRHGQGLAALSLAWGLWAAETGMTAHLGTVAGGRSGRTVMIPLATRDGLALLDAAATAGQPALVPAGFDTAVLRAAAAAGQLPRLLGALAPAARPIAAAAVAGLAGRLAGLDSARRDQLLTELVREQAAAVLGYTSAGAVGAGQAFKDLGFDSLTAVELRNRLAATAGRPLPATLVFDYPTPAALAGYLRTEVLQDDPADVVPLLAELDRIESIISAATPDNAIRTQVATRLRNILSKWNGSGDDADSVTVTQKLEAATDDEMLEFIHKEFGRPIQ